MAQGERPHVQCVRHERRKCKYVDYRASWPQQRAKVVPCGAVCLHPISNSILSVIGDPSPIVSYRAARMDVPRVLRYRGASTSYDVTVEKNCAALRPCRSPFITPPRCTGPSSCSAGRQLPAFQRLRSVAAANSRDLRVPQLPLRAAAARGGHSPRRHGSSSRLVTQASTYAAAIQATEEEILREGLPALPRPHELPPPPKSSTLGNVRM